jgi:hypothetical protein
MHVKLLRRTTGLLAIIVVGSFLAGCGPTTPPPPPGATHSDSPAPGNPADNVFAVPDAAVLQWTGVVPDQERENDMPAGGVIASQASFESLSRSWRGSEVPPVVDFAMYLVLVDASRESQFAGLSFKGPDEKGDIQLITAAKASPPPQGIGYIIALVKRPGIKSVNGQLIPTN